jgi:serine/threonine protein kinase
MASENDSAAPEHLRQAIHTRHPGIHEEIDHAITTLRKLQDIAGPVRLDDRTEGNDTGPATSATTDLGPSQPDVETPEGEGPQRAAGGAGGGREVPALAAGECFGRYQITRILGRGAMGAVYLAYDSQLARYVALKTPFVENNPLSIKRFYREAQAAAQLRSPHTCPTYDVGQIAGIHYLSMAFIDGQTLGRVLTDGKLKDFCDIAGVVKKIARGLQKAHERGIVHRDLKPENVMIDPDGEPIVMDFGLARRVDDDIQITAPGRILGTPAYMSPEQVEGDPKKIGPATDIYSLGVVLYQMLTGRLPFRGSLTSVLRQICSEEPPRPSTINPAVGEGSPLERICLKMMEKSPASRYASMADVVRELDEVTAPQGTPPVRSSRNRIWQRVVSCFAFLRRKENLPEGSGGIPSGNTVRISDPEASSPSGDASAAANISDLPETRDF